VKKTAGKIPENRHKKNETKRQKAPLNGGHGVEHLGTGLAIIEHLSPFKNNPAPKQTIQEL
jgi:hypothetical protein